MRMGQLKKVKGTTKKRKRVGRGPGSGHGKTSTRGHKGQMARSGSRKRPRFEGGQMPLQIRLPKRGFTNIFKKVYQIVNLESLKDLQNQALVTPEVLKKMGLIKKEEDPVKILAKGEFSIPITIQAHAFSKKAKEKIESCGGKIEVIR
jgi:large subunit ribosomal protein L15